MIGFSFTGKSSVGKLVAERLGWSFVDLDREIVKTTGKAIPEIFSREGEKAFRAYESRVLKEVLRKEHQVVATGGGVVISEANRRLMKDSGLVVCLEARPETIYRRLLDDRERSASPEERPLLAGDDPLGRIAALKEARRPYYQVAHATVATDGLGIEEVASSVVRLAAQGVALRR
ncbi:MAG: shikimate kinase [Chloroflexi bacterium]|nr:shikimate kinase [Chloroflexota bacterium]